MVTPEQVFTKGPLIPRIITWLAFFVMTLILIHALSTFEPSRKLGVQIEIFLIDLMPLFFLMLAWLIAMRWPLAGAAGLGGMGYMLMYYYEAVPLGGGWKEILLFLGFPLPLFLSALLALAGQMMSKRHGRRTVPSDDVPTDDPA